MSPLSELQFQLIDTSHKIAFDCDDPDLNDFFCNDAIPYQSGLLAKTYKYVTHDKNIVAMLSLCNDIIAISNNKKRKTFHRSKHLPSYPAVKIARLGVATSKRSNGIGTAIIHFLMIFFLVRNKTGCRFITVDAYNKSRTLNFYEKNGFKYITEKDILSKTRTMYLDLLPYHQTINENKDLKERIYKMINDVFGKTDT